MTQPVQWCYDLTEIHEVMACLAEAMVHEDRLCDYKRPLRNARDVLARNLEAFALEAMEKTHEREYLACFDALSYLSDALRGPAVKPRCLGAAFAELKEVFTIELSE